MAVPPNLTPGTAEVLLLPATISVAAADVQDSPNLLHGLWYRYEAVATDVAIGVWASMDVPTAIGGVAAYTDPNGAALQDAMGAPYYLQVTPGTTYYFFVYIDAPLPFTQPLIFSVLRSPTEAIPLGALLIPSDEVGFPATILSPTDGHVLQMVRFPSGEHGDNLATGELLVERDHTDLVSLRNPDLTEAATVAGTTVNGVWPRISQDGLGTFYVGYNDAQFTAIVHAVSALGVVGSSWALGANSFGLTALAPTRDGSILYYATSVIGDGIHRHDLATDTPLADFVAGTAQHNVITSGITVLDDGTLLVGYRNRTPNPDVYFVRHYAADGSTIADYACGDITLNRVVRAEDDPDSFWVWLWPDFFTNLMRFTRVRTSDFAELASFDVIAFIAGLGPTITDLDAPIPRFGPPFTCPLIVLREAIGPPEPPAPGSITVIKRTNLATPTRFAFTATGLLPATFTLGKDESQVFGNLASGVYGIAETVPAGWTLAGITVSNGSPAAAITVDVGEDVVVIVTDTQAVPAPGVPGCGTGMAPEAGSGLGGCPAAFFDPL